jgi:hypothetical protein
LPMKRASEALRSFGKSVQERRDLLGEDAAKNGARELLRASLESGFDLFAFQDPEEARRQ